MRWDKGTLYAFCMLRILDKPNGEGKKLLLPLLECKAKKKKSTLHKTIQTPPFDKKIKFMQTCLPESKRNACALMNANKSFHNVMPQASLEQKKKVGRGLDTHSKCRHLRNAKTHPCVFVTDTQNTFCDMSRK